MNSNRLVKLLILAAALNISGCGGGTEKAGVDVKAAGTPPAVNAASPTPANSAVANAVAPQTDTAATHPASAGGGTPGPGTPRASESRGAGSAPSAPMPTTRIGSGGNDLFLFTQARAAVNADPELRAANLIIEVKEGIVTLNGTVPSTALKAKAEELARGAGPKDVRNQLRVAAGK